MCYIFEMSYFILTNINELEMGQLSPVFIRTIRHVLALNGYKHLRDDTFLLFFYKNILHFT